MCKYSPGCGSSDSFKCKSCGTALCKQCSRSLKTGNPPSSGNGAQCGDCKKNFRWLKWFTYSQSLFTHIYKSFKATLEISLNFSLQEK